MPRQGSAPFFFFSDEMVEPATNYAYDGTNRDGKQTLDAAVVYLFQVC